MKLRILFGHIADYFSGPSFLRETWTMAQAERDFEGLFERVQAMGKAEVVDGDDTVVFLRSDHYERLRKEAEFLNSMGISQG